MTSRTVPGAFWPDADAGDEGVVGAHLGHQLAQRRVEVDAVDVDRQPRRVGTTTWREASRPSDSMVTRV
jgi:hypothetical protein